MIFHEIYSLYYKTVTCLIQSSFTHVNEIINENAFKESFMMLEEALERWPIKNIDVSTYPLTLLQKRWLKAISLDPRMQLFSYSWAFLDDVEPLFTPDDIYIYEVELLTLSGVVREIKLNASNGELLKDKVDD